jgi:hypothetical protein
MRYWVEWRELFTGNDGINSDTFTYETFLHTLEDDTIEVIAYGTYDPTDENDLTATKVLYQREVR